MASDHPSDPRPDDAKAEHPLSDWLTPEEPGPSAGAETPPAEPLPEDALADLPPAEPAMPGSGWLGASAAPPAAAPAQPSDVTIGPDEAGSDVLQTVASPNPDSSNIFDTSPGGSARFEDPAEATEDVAEAMPVPDPEGLYADLAEPREPASGSFEADDREADAADILSGSDDDVPAADVVDFDSMATDPDIEIHVSESGVDLLNPSAEPAPGAGPGSSIFAGAPDDGTGLEPALPRPPDTGDAENIHRPGGPGSASDIFIPLPADQTEPHEPAPAEEDEPDGGAIDWSLPESDVPDRQVSQRMTLDDTEGIDLEALAAQFGMEEEPPPERTAAPTPVGPPVTRTPRVATPPPVAAAEAPAPLPGEVEERPARPEPRREVRRRPAEAERDRPAAKSKSGVGGWIGGTAVGLLLGVGAAAGAYFAGLLPSKEAAPARNPGPSAAVNPGPAPQQPAPAGGPEEAKALLAAGDPARALKGFEAAGEDASVEVKAGRGQARWLARVRELAETGTPVTADDPQIKQAEADLKAVVDGDLKTEADKQAGVRAALHLGLIHEATGDGAGATAVYRDAMAKFPASKPVFLTALRRMQATRLPGKAVGLAPRDADELAHLAAFALLFLQGDAPAEKVEDEPGFYFWEACSLASAQDYMGAANTISKARAAHEKRRLKLAGRGLNPLSDPLEQIFTRACTDLREYWVMKNHFYNNPVVGKELQAAARGGNLPKFLTELGNQRQEVAKAQEQARKATADARARTDELQVKLTAADKKVKAAQDLAAKEKEEATAAAKALTDARKSLADAQARETEAVRKQKAAEGTLAAMVKDLKAAKLIDEKDDAAAALAKLPDVLKKATAAATSADAQKAAAALLEVRKELDAARDDARAAKLARADAEKKLTAAKADADALAKKAAEAAQTDLRKRLDEAEQQRAAAEQARRQAEKDFAAKLAALEEEHRRQMADVRSGVVMPLSSGEQAARERAVGSYDAGVDLYFAGRYAQAEAALERATKDDPADARYWYFLGLSRYMQGKSADEAFKKGAELEVRNQPNGRLIRAALERVQGPARQALSAYRP